MTAPHVPDVEIRRAAWGGAYERGVVYARSGAVHRVTWDPDDSTLSGIVAGSRSELYRCSIRLDTSGARPRIMTARCSCPMAEHCKHTVATLVATAALRRTESRGCHRRADHPEPSSDWLGRLTWRLGDDGPQRDWEPLSTHLPADLREDAA